VLIQHDAILPALYERVAIPPAVLADLQHSRTPELVRAWAAHRPAWLEVHRPRQVLDARRFPRLGPGNGKPLPSPRNSRCLCC
jgi:hypothetical protein